MYEAFYGLTSKPFQINPDPSFYFGSKQHRRAKAYLEYGVLRNEGFIVITGEVGAGKTTVVRGLLAGLDADKVVSANLVTTQLDAEDTLRMVGAAFGVRVKDLSKSEVLMALETFLLEQTTQGKRCLLIVDEAQNLTVRAVEELRMLSNFQFGQQALLQTFLVGQPEFRAILQSPEMQQLRQRVTATSHIGPMDLPETQGYIEHRLKRAGATDRPTFDAAAFEAIYRASAGIPRRINLICDRLLLLGFLSEKYAFGLDDVNEVVSEINGESMTSSVKDPAPGAAWDDSLNKAVTTSYPVDFNLSKLQLSPARAHSLSAQIDALGMEQLDVRLRRMESSTLRLERINLELLLLMQKLVEGVTRPAPEKDQ